MRCEELRYGRDQLKVLSGLNNLAGLYYDQGRYADAEPLYKRDLSIGKKALGPEHPYVGTSLNLRPKLSRSWFGLPSRRKARPRASQPVRRSWIARLESHSRRWS